ncbi:MAG: phosphatidylglycerophosphatase A [Nitrospirota bacterium]
MKTFQKNIILFIAQGAYSGRFPVAPGTAGSVIGVLLYLGIKDFPPAFYLIFLGMLCLTGALVSTEAEKILGSKDNCSIVIDEIAGFLVAMFLVPYGWGFLIAGFLLFRFFDIMKPWPIRKVERFSGGWGVMLDDIGAGIYTNVVLQIFAAFLA